MKTLLSVLTILVASLAAGSAYGQVPQLGCPGNPEPERLKGLCRQLAEKNAVDGENPLKYRYEYEKMMYSAACSRRDEDERVAQAKIQRLWREHVSSMVCRNATSTSMEADVLKYAASSEAFHFLTLAATKWKVDLNISHSSDSRTLIDYIEDEMVKARGKPFWNTLNRYHQMLVAAGAKRRDELPKAR